MAGSSGAIRAGRAFIELFADDGPLQKGLKRAETLMKGWGKNVTSAGQKAMAAGAAAVTPLAGATASFAVIGADLTDMSKRTGASTEALSTLGYAAKQCGADASQVANAMTTVRDKIVDAARGGEESQLAFARLGLNFQQLSRMKPEEQFRLIGQQLNKIENPALRAAFATQALGSADLLPMIEQMGELEKRAKALGLEFTTNDAAAAKKLEMGITDLWETAKMLGNQIGSALAPTLTEWVSNATSIAVKTGQWIKANKETIVTVFKVAASVMAAGAATVALGTALTYGAGILGTIAAAFSFLLSPIGLTIAAVVGLGTAFVTQTETGQKALGWLMDKFSELKATAEETFAGISDALSAGDIGLAMEILWLTLKQEWTKGVNFLLEYWTGFKAGFQKVAIDAFYGVLEISNNVWASMKAGWAEFINWFTNKWKAAQNGIAEKMIDVMAFFDSSIDADDAKKTLNEDYNRDKEKRDTGHAANLKQIEKDRLAREDNLAGQNIETNAGIDQNAKDEIKARKDAYDKLVADRKNALAKAKDLREAGTPEAKKTGETAGAGLNTMRQQVAGIGATDIRTSQGFSAVMASLRESNGGPQQRMVELLGQANDMGKRDMRNLQDVRDKVNTLTTRDF